jgi:hypothetical protein
MPGVDEPPNLRIGVVRAMFCGAREVHGRPRIADTSGAQDERVEIDASGGDIASMRVSRSADVAC